MIIVAGKTYESYEAVVTQDTDDVLQGQIDGMLDIAPGEVLTLDGAAYFVDSIAWLPDPAQTKIRAVRAQDESTIVSRIIADLPAQVTRWAGLDTFVARLVAIAGGGDGYAQLIAADIGDAKDLPTIRRVLRENLFDIRYHAAGARPTLIPIWRTVGAAVPVTVAGSPEYRRNGRLTSDIPTNALAAAQVEDAKAAAQSVANALADVLRRKEVIARDIANQLITSTFQNALRAFGNRPSGGYTAGDLANIQIVSDTLGAALALNDWAAAQDLLLDDWLLIYQLRSLLNQYDTALGAQYIAARNALTIYGSSGNIVTTLAIDALGVWYGATKQALAANNITLTPTATSAIISALVTAYAQLGADITTLTNITTAIASVPIAATPAQTAARYLDDAGGELTFPPGLAAATNVRFVKDIQPDRFTAVIRVMQADMRARMNAGRVSLQPIGGATTAGQYGLITADLGLPNAVTQYRVESVRQQRRGSQADITLDCAALPSTIAPPAGQVTEFGRVSIIPRSVTAEKTGQRLGQRADLVSGGQPTQFTRDLTVRAYAVWGMNQLAVRQEQTDDYALTSVSQRTQDYVYVYAGDDHPAHVYLADNTRGGTYGAAATTAGYTAGNATVRYNERAVGYALIRRGDKYWLCAAIAGWAQSGNPLRLYDTLYVSLLELDPANNWAMPNPNVWQTFAIPTTNIGRHFRHWPAGANTTTGIAPVIWQTDVDHLRAWALPYTNQYPVGYNIDLGATGITDIEELNARTIFNSQSISANAYIGDDRWSPEWPMISDVGDIFALAPDGMLHARDLLPRFADIGQTGISGATALGHGHVSGFHAIDAQHRVWTIRTRTSQVTAPIIIR